MLWDDDKFLVEKAKCKSLVGWRKINNKLTKYKLYIFYVYIDINYWPDHKICFSRSSLNKLKIYYWFLVLWIFNKLYWASELQEIVIRWQHDDYMLWLVSKGI